jgi:hypothetical protein
MNPIHILQDPTLMFSINGILHSYDLFLQAYFVSKVCFPPQQASPQEQQQSPSSDPSLILMDSFPMPLTADADAGSNHRRHSPITQLPVHPSHPHDNDHMHWFRRFTPSFATTTTVNDTNDDDNDNDGMQSASLRTSPYTMASSPHIGKNAKNAFAASSDHTKLHGALPSAAQLAILQSHLRPGANHIEYILGWKQCSENEKHDTPSLSSMKLLSLSATLFLWHSTAKLILVELDTVISHTKPVSTFFGSFSSNLNDHSKKHDQEHSPYVLYDGATAFYHRLLHHGYHLVYVTQDPTPHDRLQKRQRQQQRWPCDIHTNDDDDGVCYDHSNRKTNQLFLHLLHPQLAPGPVFFSASQMLPQLQALFPMDVHPTYAAFLIKNHHEMPPSSTESNSSRPIQAQATNRMPSAASTSSVTPAMTMMMNSMARHCLPPAATTVPPGWTLLHVMTQSGRYIVAPGKIFLMDPLEGRFALAHQRVVVHMAMRPSYQDLLDMPCLFDAMFPPMMNTHHNMMMMMSRSPRTSDDNNNNNHSIVATQAEGLDGDNTLAENDDDDDDDEKDCPVQEKKETNERIAPQYEPAQRSVVNHRRHRASQMNMQQSISCPLSSSSSSSPSAILVTISRTRTLGDEAFNDVNFWRLPHMRL